MDDKWSTSVSGSNFSNLTSSSEEQLSPDTWGWWIKQIVTPLVVVIGLTGNVLSFILMKTKSWRHKSYSHYICALAIFDSLTLINREVNLINGMKIYASEQGLFTNFNDTACSVFNFYEHLCYVMSSWLIVAMATERFIAVYFPLKKAYFCTQTGAVIVICILVTFLTFTQSFRFLMVGNVRGTCGPIENYLVTYTSLHIYMYQFGLICGLPIGLIIIFNVLVLRRIYRVKKLRFREDKKFRRTTRSPSKRHKTTLMLMSITFFYVITLLPSLIISIIVHVAILMTPPRNPPVALFLSISPFNDLFELVSDLNYACNFFIYILSGKILRLELRKLFAANNAYSTSTTKFREDGNLF